MRFTPTAAFAIQATLPRSNLVTSAYTPPTATFPGSPLGRPRRARRLHRSGPGRSHVAPPPPRRLNAVAPFRTNHMKAPSTPSRPALRTAPRRETTAASRDLEMACQRLRSQADSQHNRTHRSCQWPFAPLSAARTAREARGVPTHCGCRAQRNSAFYRFDLARTKEPSLRANQALVLSESNSLSVLLGTY